MDGAKIVSDKVVPQRVCFNAGPRIGRVQVIEHANGQRFEVRFWYNNDGKLHHLDCFDL